MSGTNDTSSATVPMKPMSELNYSERHALRHLRHERDNEYSRIAFKRCKEYAQFFSVCQNSHPFSAPFVCRTELNEMKQCVNRNIQQLRAEHKDLNSLPLIHDTTEDYDAILEEHLMKQQQQQQQQQYKQKEMENYTSSSTKTQ